MPAEIESFLLVTIILLLLLFGRSARNFISALIVYRKSFTNGLRTYLISRENNGISSSSHVYVKMTNGRRTDFVSVLRDCKF